MRNPELNQLRRLFAAADDGIITLPDEVNEAREVLARLAEPYDRPGLDDLSEEITAAALAGTDFPTVDSVAVRLSRTEAAGLLEQARTDAHERASNRLFAVTQEMATSIIVGHLRPLHDRVVADLRAAVAAIGPNGFDPIGLLAAPPKVRDARHRLEDIVRRYQTLTAVLGVLAAHSPSVYDANGYFSFCRNGYELWPRRTGMGASPAPWPTEAVARAVWLVQNGADFWCPTGQERDQAWAEAFPDAPALRGRDASALGWEKASGHTAEPSYL